MIFNSIEDIDGIMFLLDQILRVFGVVQDYTFMSLGDFFREVLGININITLPGFDGTWLDSFSLGYFMLSLGIGVFMCLGFIKFVKSIVL